MISLLSLLSEALLPKSMVVRNIEDEVFARLRQRAARHGRSLEAEVRDILKRIAASEAGSDFWDRAARLRESTKERAQTPAELLLGDGPNDR
jgi:plasmid stability protein